MKIGCSTLLFGGVDFRQAIDAIAELGFDAIELCTIPGMGEHLFIEQPDSYYHDVKAAIAARGLILESVGASTSLVDAAGRDRFKKAIEAAAKVGAPYITTGSGGQVGDEDSFKAAIDAIHEVTEVAKSAGVKISIKPHVGAAVYNTATALRMLESVDTEWVGINFDPTHVYREGDDPIEAMTALKNHIFTARIRDTGARPGERPIGPVENQIPGKGTMDVAAIAEAYKQVPGLEIVTVEIVGTRDMPIDEVKRVCRETKEFLDRCFA
ncbi:MAG: sugar phosphate isomerase/epimerase [Armatimonadetes bacterium]|nr:sugar phosphate isomerase/epimerase [Armatimonadota bacterium]